MGHAIVGVSPFPALSPRSEQRESTENGESGGSLLRAAEGDGSGGGTNGGDDWRLCGTNLGRAQRRDVNAEIAGEQFGMARNSRGISNIKLYDSWLLE